MEIIIGVVAFVLATWWSIFPVIIYLQIKQTNKHLKQIDENLQLINYRGEKVHRATAPQEP